MSQLELLRRISSVRVLVVGDIMLDHYRIGDARRISPEAPVPILLNPHEEYRVGGAAAVAGMCAALGAETVLLGVVGPDRNGEKVHQMLTELGVCSLTIVDPDRVTTTKERICGVASGRHRQQLGRIDFETVSPLASELSQRIVDVISGAATNPPDIILISDYAKGMMTDSIARACRDTGVLVIVDPPKNGEWEKYEHVGCVVPNREESAGRSASEIQFSLNTIAAVVKLDQDGCELSDEQGELRRIRSKPRSVHDVTGAGDQFIAVLGCVLATGGGWHAAAEMATIAAGLQVERHGCVPVTHQDITSEICNDISKYEIPAY